MSDKKLTILGIVAVIAIAAAIVVNQASKPRQISNLVIGPLVGGLDVDQIAKITISGQKGEQKTTLSRNEGKFVIVEKDNYPAGVKKVNELVAQCLDIRTAELRTEDPAFHKDLGVTEDSAKSVITLWDAENKPIVGILISESSEENRGAYVRLASENKVYLTLNSPWISAVPMDYVDKEILKVNTGKIVEVTITDPNQHTYALQSKDGGQTITSPITLPTGKRLKESDCKRVFNAPGGIQIEDVAAANKLEGLKLDRRYVCKLDDSTVYTFQLGEKDKKTWLAAAAQFTDTVPVTKEKGVVESDEQLKAKEAKLLARDAADRFAKKTAGWLFVIADYTAAELKKKIQDLVEDIPAEAKPADPNQPAGR
ncbi:MAG: DUF4340 domain-containing protein [Planctomycetes bacterium]|nr:DUF4340 domain-containing protein [Planctomycetota bacterium]